MEVEPPKTPIKQELADTPKPICKYCKGSVLENAYFCPTCGKRLKEPPFKFYWGNFIKNMILTILFPPLGIFPGIKHLKMPNQTAKILGSIYIILTIMVTIITIKIFVDFINNANEMLNDTYVIQDYVNSSSGSTIEQVNELKQFGL